MDMGVIIYALLFVSVGMLVYQFFSQKLVEEVHLPPEITGKKEGATIFEKILNTSVSYAEPYIPKDHAIVASLKRKLLSAGEPMKVNQLLVLKLFSTALVPFLVLILLKPQPPLLIFSFLIGYMIPDLWLKSKIKQRQAAVLKDLPHIIDLLNICVGAGLDFMVAVNRVIQEFRPCVVVDELRMMVREIQMGSSRRDALKNIAARVNSPEVVSFVRTLLQADRMGTPIGEALKVQAEEIRFRRFQRGEEMALKAPIKLLAPLLLFILPVVLIIVAGPIMIQFTRGGLMKLH